MAWLTGEFVKDPSSLPIPLLTEKAAGNEAHQGCPEENLCCLCFSLIKTPEL